MIPQTFIQDLLNRIDIVDVVGHHVQLKKGGANLMGLCPFHNEKSPSFTVSPAKQFYHCFGCGAHGSAIGFLMEYTGLNYVEAIKDLAQGIGVTVPDDDRNDNTVAPRRTKAGRRHALGADGPRRRVLPRAARRPPVAVKSYLEKARPLGADRQAHSRMGYMRPTSGMRWQAKLYGE